MCLGMLKGPVTTGSKRSGNAGRPSDSRRTEDGGNVEGHSDKAEVRTASCLLHSNPETNKAACFVNRWIGGILTKSIGRDNV